MFKTQKEIFQALIDGKKIRYKDWNKKEYAWLIAGLLTGREGTHLPGFKFSYHFGNYEEWELYEEPKAKVKLYAYVDQFVVGGGRWSIFFSKKETLRGCIRLSQFDCEVDGE